MATQTRQFESIALTTTTPSQQGSLHSRTISHHEPPPPPPLLAPPISRKKQFSVLASAFVAIALTIGYNQCFGVFQEYYLSPNQDMLVVHRSSSSSSEEQPPVALLAFVGTLCYGLTWAGGVLVNPVITRIEHGTWSSSSSSGVRWRRKLVLPVLTNRTITVSGVLLMVAGFGLASLSTAVWHLLLTQGFLVGLGMSLVYFPLLAPAPEYFTRHRATAMGVILAGGGAGGLILSPIFRALLTNLGGRWTLRIYAVFNLVAGLPIAWSVPRSRFSSSSSVTSTTPTTADADTNGDTNDPSSTSHNGSTRPNTHISRSLSQRPTFFLSCIAAFLQAAGAQTPLAFIPSYTTDKLGLSTSQGANFLAIANAINAVARIITGYLGDRMGRQNTLIAALLLSSTSVFVFWLGSIDYLPSHSSTTARLSALENGHAGTSKKLWMAFIVVYSVGAGGYYALFPALIAEVFGIRAYPAVNAFLLFVRGLGTMLGSPVGGRLLGEKRDEYRGLACWDGALLMASVVCCFGVRWADARGKGGWRWVA